MVNKIVPNHAMAPFLQYYKKNTILRCCFMGFLIIIYASGGYSQTARFRYEKRNNCAPARVVFYNESTTGPGISYEWNFGNGSISYSSETVLEEVYLNNGNYTAELKVIKGDDTVKTSSVITVFKGPVARFSADQRRDFQSPHSALTVGNRALDPIWTPRRGIASDLFHAVSGLQI